jgi:alpha-beta hydrolase superfamily lysophospholipase
MGSFMAQQFIAETGHLLAGCVLSGSTGRPEPRVQLLRVLAYGERFRLGPRGRSRMLHKFSLDTANQQFRPTRTDFDWLSRDTAEVDKFIADPLCGFVGTTQLWIDLLQAVFALCRPDVQSGIPRHLPVYVVSGSRDSVSHNTRGLLQLLDAYRRAGLTRIEHRFYPEGRHEIFNELNRDEVTGDLVRWLDSVTARRQASDH